MLRLPLRAFVWRDVIVALAMLPSRMRSSGVLCLSRPYAKMTILRAFYLYAAAVGEVEQRRQMPARRCFVERGDSTRAAAF